MTLKTRQKTNHMKKALVLLVGLTATVLSFAAVLDNRFNAAFGPLFHRGSNVPPPVAPTQGLDALHRWNLIAINASGLDHTPVAPGENRIFGEQFGPTRASRAMAIIHIAIFDAVSAIDGHFKTYTGLGRAPADTSMECAVAQAACETLDALFPSQKPTFDQELTYELAQIANSARKTNGISLGHNAASAILSLRVNDGSQAAEPRIGIEFITSNAPGKWRQDPISQIPIALGTYWGRVTPFVIQSSHQFRSPAPPALNSAEYAAAYN